MRPTETEFDIQDPSSICRVSICVRVGACALVTLKRRTYKLPASDKRVQLIKQSVASAQKESQNSIWQTQLGAKDNGIFFSLLLLFLFLLNFCYQ